MLQTIKRFLLCFPSCRCCCSIAFQAAKAHTKERVYKSVCICMRWGVFSRSPFRPFSPYPAFLCSCASSFADCVDVGLCSSSNKLPWSDTVDPSRRPVVIFALHSRTRTHKHTHTGLADRRLIFRLPRKIA